MQLGHVVFILAAPHDVERSPARMLNCSSTPHSNFVDESVIILSLNSAREYRQHAALRHTSLHYRCTTVDARNCTAKR